MFTRKWWKEFYEWLEHASMDELEAKQSKLLEVADRTQDERIRDDAKIAIRHIGEAIAEKIFAPGQGA